MMTIVTGLVDAFSSLGLGHVFVAFALAGAPGFSLPTSLSALAAFPVGAFGAGALGNRLGHERGRLLGISAGVQALFLPLATIMAFASGGRMSDFFLYGPIAALGVAMGIQNAAARKLAVPDLTTTVLTLTVTGMAADNKTAGGAGSRAGRRLLSVGAMFAGAAVGATLILKALPGYALFLALVVIGAVAFAVANASRHDPSWARQTQ